MTPGLNAWDITIIEVVTKANRAINFFILIWFLVL